MFELFDSFVYGSSDAMGGGAIDLYRLRTTLGIVIKQIQSQSKYQFFYSDKLSSVTVDALQEKDASLTNVLNRLLKGKNISYKVEENIVYLSDKKKNPKFLNNKLVKNVPLVET